MKSTKSKIIIAMCAVLCIMAVGYAAFSTALTITGTANIASEWKVVFTNITQVSKTSGVTIKSTPVASGTSATFDVGLTSPGDKIVYKITLANQGTIDAVIKNIEASATDSPAIIFTVDGVNIGDVINKKTSKEFNVTIEYNPATTSQPEKTNKTLTVNITMVQSTGASSNPSSPSINQPLYLSSAIFRDNIAQNDANIDFSQTIEVTGTNGLYVTSANTEDNLPTYYFRGAVENNYVKMGTYIKNTCTYNGEDVVYANLMTPTEEQCLSTNICDARLLGVGYIVGVDQETCQEVVETVLQEMELTSSMMSCQYNGIPILGIDLETGEQTLLTESECLSNNVCTASDSDVSIGISGLDQASCLEIGGEWPNAKANYYNATYPYIEEKATYTENVTKDLLWRIVRINEDGSIRLVTQEEMGVVPFNESRFDNTHVGYMYGTTGSSTYSTTHANTNDSTIKAYLDDWYEANLKTNYSSYLADAGFCNDRSVAPSAGLWASADTALGYGTNITHYGAYNRLYNNKKPQFKCQNEENDLFTTMSSTKGNKALTYPIGLLTVDEVVYAGAAYGVKNTSMYLTNGMYYWTMSPFYFLGGARMWSVDNFGYMDSFADDNYVNNVRPVINLKSTVEIDDGDGTSTNPYVVKTN